jgi:alpha-1,3-fucosyltransferase
LVTLFLVFVWNPLRSPTVVDITSGSLSGVGKGTTATASDIHDNSTNTSDALKYILYYTPFWTAPDYLFGFGQEPFQGCPLQQNCFATNDRGHLKSTGDFDAVLFHAADFNLKQNLDSILKWRTPKQRFVYMNVESPQTYSHLASYPSGFFNWTMTYRHDSDIPRPYGWIRTLEEESRTIYPPPQRETWPIVYKENRAIPKEYQHLAKRPGKVAWIVSHCDTPSRRMEYALELAKYIPVNIFGKCLGQPCNVRYGMNSLDNCTLSVNQEYKFYLSFENTFCEEYVTEKFFRRINESLVIVMGQADYTKVAPPHSYLNVMDFASPKELAGHLWELDRNDTMYLSYFWWKQYYTARSISKELVAQSMCKLCEKMHNQREPRKTYADLQEWWNQNADCGKLQAPGIPQHPQTTASRLRIDWQNG